MYRIVLDNGKEQVVLEYEFTCIDAAVQRRDLMCIDCDIKLYLFIEKYHETEYKYWETVC